MTMMINWEAIRKASDIDKLPDSMLFDEYRSYSENDIGNINPSLPEEDIERAFRWLDVMPDLTGILLVIGEEGSGKSMMAHALAWDCKYLFGKMAILDTMPRKAFGRYIPFSKEFLKEERARVNDILAGHGKVVRGQWMSSRGQVFLQNAIVMMDEFGSKHMRRLDSPTIEPKKTLLGLFPECRHYHTLYVGVGTELASFDRQCFPHVDYIMSCDRIDPPTERDPEGSNIQIVGQIRRVRYNRDRDTFYPVGEDTLVALEGSKPRDYLKGKAYKDLFNTHSVQGLSYSKSMALEG